MQLNTKVIFKNVNFSYDIKKISNINNKTLYQIKALKDLSFEAYAGDKIGIIGPNGSGKTTLLKLISKIFKQDSGSINISGTISSMLNISSGYKEDLNIEDNFNLKCILHDLNYNNIEKQEKLKMIYNFSGLNKYSNVPLKYFSSGMKARFSSALAILFGNEIILLDEWISSGDSDFKKKFSSHFNEKIKKSNLLFFASHDTNLINNICNKIITLNEGSIKSFVNI